VGASRMVGVLRMEASRMVGVLLDIWVVTGRRIRR
jgi:hypothetical protein